MTTQLAIRRKRLSRPNEKEEDICQLHCIRAVRCVRKPVDRPQSHMTNPFRRGGQGGSTGYRQYRPEHNTQCILMLFYLYSRSSLIEFSPIYIFVGSGNTISFPSLHDIFVWYAEYIKCNEDLLFKYK